MSTESMVDRRSWSDAGVRVAPAEGEQAADASSGRKGTGIWTIRRGRWETAGLRRAARRDPRIVEISGRGANATPRIGQCFAEYETSMTQELLVATRAVTPMLDQLLRLLPELAQARQVLEATGRRADQEQPPAGLLPGEEPMTQELVMWRQGEQRRRREESVRAEADRAAVVHASLQARVDVLAERIRARVRLAQVGGLAAYHKAVTQIDVYAEHLVRHHPQGATLVQIGWPHPLRAPESWLSDEREALQLVCGSASWIAHTSDTGEGGPS